jgi:hypothetical protein
MSVLGRMAPVAIVIGAAVAARVVIKAGPETQAATEMPVVVEVTTHRAAGESPANTAEMASANAAAHMTATESAAHMTATESTAHMTATTETATVSTPSTATVSTSTSPAVRSKRVSGQSPCESGSRSENDHDLAQHCTYSF